MALLLICLIYIAFIIKAQNLTLREKAFIRLPFSVYFGWITVAAIANATTLLVSLGWNGFGLSETVWTIIMLGAGLLIGMTTTLRLKDMAYGLVVVWAYAGILIKHTSTAGFSNQYSGVILAVAICIALLVASVLYVLFIRMRKPLQNSHT
jgi:hypothetical protein